MTTVRLRERFGQLLGNWTGIEEHAGSPSSPGWREGVVPPGVNTAPGGRGGVVPPGVNTAAGTSARAAMTFKIDVADLVVVQDYRQVRADGREYLAHGVFMIDSGTGGLRWWLFDSDGQPPVVAEGGWHDGEMILQQASPQGLARHRFSVADDRLRYRISIQQGDTGEQDILTGSYRRISGH